MSADIVSLQDWKVTRNADAATARWCRRLQASLLANMSEAQRAKCIAAAGAIPLKELGK